MMKNASTSFLLLLLAVAASAALQHQDNDYLEPLCFETRDELDQAIQDYLSRDDERRRDVELVYGSPMASWCTTRITDFSFLFEAKTQFNEPLNGWDVSNAITMEGMFYRAESFNQDLSSWNVANVQDMTAMFAHAQAFDQDLSAWDVHSVTSLRATFLGTTSFRACHSLLHWNTINLVDSEMMLAGTTCEIQDELLLQLGEDIFLQEDSRA